MRPKTIKLLKYIGLSIALLLLLSVLLSFVLSFVESLRLVFGTAFLLIVPGLVWSFVIWNSNTIKLFERALFSIALSIFLVPLIVFLFNKTGLSINALNVFIECSGVVVIGLLIIFLQKTKLNKSLSDKLHTDQ